MRHRSLVCLALLITAAGHVAAQRADPQVPVVETVGCAEQRGEAWWVVRATEPTPSRLGVFDETQVDAARAASLGEQDFQLIGAAEFLSEEELIATGDRALFTTSDQVNATGQLRDGHTVLLKGLLIEAAEVSRINLLAVVGLAETCE